MLEQSNTVQFGQAELGWVDRGSIPYQSTRNLRCLAAQSWYNHVAASGMLLCSSVGSQRAETVHTFSVRVSV
jgi:hypothetical protein